MFNPYKILQSYITYINILVITLKFKFIINIYYNCVTLMILN